MSEDDPQTEDERAAAICYVVTVRLGERWRPFGVTLGSKARVEMIAALRESKPDLARGWVSLERGQ